LELQSQGYRVDMYTAHHNTSRCFEETLQGGKRASWIHIHGDFLPRHLFGCLHAVLAYLRCLWAAMAIVLSGCAFDVVIVDQVSVPILLLRWLTRSRILFYCHFPDLLLAKRTSALRALYRAPIDALEEVSTGRAHAILVNSEFTAGVFARTFKRLGHLKPAVLYPAVDVAHFLSVPPPPSLSTAGSNAADPRTTSEEMAPDIPHGCHTFLSINRFERKKDLGLALRALALVKRTSGHPIHLVMAGGYDARLAENVEHLHELKELARSEGISSNVTFVPSFSDEQRAGLLAGCVAVLYTPQNEHFGIVPLEGMAAGRAVIACNSGGPLESIVDKHTGFLCDPDPMSWADAMQQLLNDSSLATSMGIKARAHVQRKFSRVAMGQSLGKVVEKLVLHVGDAACKEE